MPLIFDGRETDSINISPEDRGLLYGDGVFESIIISKEDKVDSSIPFHIRRLQQGCNLLKFAHPEGLPNETAVLTQYLHDVASFLCPDVEVVRLRLCVWRKPGGLYTPCTNASHFLITGTEYQPIPYKAAYTGIATSVRLSSQPIAACKTISALAYVLAAQERAQNNWDEILIRNTESNLAEAGSANLFFIDQDGQIIGTPANNGAIAGVMQAMVIEHMRQAGKPVLFKNVRALRQQDFMAAFVTNVAGIKSLTNIDGYKFAENPEAKAVIQALRDKLCPYQQA
jgi:branched-subunit amino acid aminotransferase/4-amino-4-deoxychorismate lyase